MTNNPKRPRRRRTRREPKCYVYHWAHDESMTRHEILQHARITADALGVAGPTEFIDDSPDECFNNRPAARRMLKRLRPQDHLVISATAIPGALECFILYSRFIREKTRVHMLDLAFQDGPQSYTLTDRSLVFDILEERLIELLCRDGHTATNS